MGRLFNFLVKSVVETVISVHRSKAVLNASRAMTIRQYGMHGGGRGLDVQRLGGPPAQPINVDDMQKEVEREAIVALCGEVTPVQILKSLTETLIEKLEAIDPVEKARVVEQYEAGMEKMFGPGAAARFKSGADPKFKI